MNPHKPCDTESDIAVPWWHWGSYGVLLFMTIDAIFSLIGGLPIAGTAQVLLDMVGREVEVSSDPLTWPWHTALVTLPPLYVVLLLEGIRYINGGNIATPWQASHTRWRMRTIVWFFLLYGLLHTFWVLLQQQGQDGIWQQRETQLRQLFDWARGALYLWLLLRLGCGLIWLDSMRPMPRGIRWLSMVRRPTACDLWYWLGNVVLGLAAVAYTTTMFSHYRAPERMEFHHLWHIGGAQLLLLAFVLCCIDLVLAATMVAWRARLHGRSRIVGGFMGIHILLLSLPWFAGEILDSPTGMLLGISLQYAICLWLLYHLIRPLLPPRIPRTNVHTAAQPPVSRALAQATSPPLFWNQASYFFLLLAAGIPLLRCAFSLADIPLPVFGLAQWEAQPLFYAYHALGSFSLRTIPESLLSLLIFSLPPLLVLTLLVDICSKKAAKNTWQASHYHWRMRTMLWFFLLHAVQQIAYAPLLNGVMWYGGLHLIWVFSCVNASIYFWLLYRCMKGMWHLYSKPQHTATIPLHSSFAYNFSQP